MKLLLRFEFYSEEELAILLQQRTHGLTWIVEEVVFSLIAQRSRGTPRLALRLFNRLAASVERKVKEPSA